MWGTPVLNTQCCWNAAGQHFVVWKANTGTHAHMRIYGCDQEGKVLMRSLLISGLAHGQVSKRVKFSTVAFLLSSLSSWVLFIKLLSAIRCRDPHWAHFPSTSYCSPSRTVSPLEGFSHVSRVLSVITSYGKLIKAKGGWHCRKKDNWTINL